MEHLGVINTVFMGHTAAILLVKKDTAECLNHSQRQALCVEGICI